MNHRKIKPIIGISIGDINGISIEVTIKALLDARIQRLITPVIYAHSKALNFYKKEMELDEFNYLQIKSLDEVHHKKINVINVFDECPEIHPGVETHEAGKLALAALNHAISDLKANKLDALVTAPLNKNNINQKDIPFVGHTEYLTEAFGVKDSLMFMVSEDIRVGLVTGHVPLKEVPKKITSEALAKKLDLMITSLTKDFGILKPRIAVLGLNPHASEDGLLGSEETEIIIPQVRAFKEKGHLVFGPYPADGFFGMMHHKKFDGVLAMYHDQGLIPFKT